MPSRNLPQRPSLDQLKLQAKELQALHDQKRLPAAARIIANHPRFRDETAAHILATPLKLSDAQLVIAREYGFDSWAKLKEHVETGQRLVGFEPHPEFDEAVNAIRSGDIATLRALLDAHPELVHARTNLEPPFGYFTGATLLHHIAWNPSQNAPVPPNVVDIARVLIERGADVEAETLGRNGGSTLGLIVTSRMASEANASGPLIDLLIAHGVQVDTGPNSLDAPLTNHAPRAAEKLIELGATPDVLAAAALGSMSLLERQFDTDGKLIDRPRRHGKLLSERDAIGLALLYAYVNKRQAAVELLLQKDGNWNMTGVNNGTVMHRAAWDGDLAMVKTLVEKGADYNNRDNPFNSTPLSWAQHNKQRDVFDWLVKHVKIDIHEAVANNLRDHVEARVREDPSVVNKRVDQWETRLTTPLYWAAWMNINDTDSSHRWDEGERESLVRFLLDHGADPNILSGDGLSPVDVATAAGADRIVKLLRERGGRSASEL
jgi:ankyrin repeat protein